MEVDWNLLFVGGTFAIVLASAIGGLNWFIIRLVFIRLQEDIQEIKEQLKLVVPIVKTEKELETMIRFEIAKKREECEAMMERKIKEAKLKQGE